MSLENLIVQKDGLRSAAENILINELIEDQAKDDIIMRFFSHHPCVILGKSQNENEANRHFCEANDIDVLSRNSGGAGIYADESVLCYSFFIPTRILGSKLSDIYEMLTKPIVDQLPNTALEGTYYVTHKGKKLIGHAMKKGKEYIQLDGLVHTKGVPVQKIKDTISMREVYKHEDQLYVKVNDNAYKLVGRTLKTVEKIEGHLIRDERNEILQITSLDELNISSEDFVNRVVGAYAKLFSKIPKYNIYPNNLTPPKSNPIKGLSGGKGHCFIYIPELESEKGVIYESRFTN